MDRRLPKQIDPIISQRMKQELIRKEIPRLAAMSQPRTRMSAVRKPKHIATIPESMDDDVQHGLGITKQRFHTRTLAESPDSEYYQGLHGQ